MSVTGIVRPYGDTTGDGRVQLSFTLPVPFGDEAERARAEGAALQLAGKMGLDPAMVVHAKGMGPDVTFFIVYGRVSHLVDLDAVTVAEREFPVLPAVDDEEGEVRPHALGVHHHGRVQAHLGRQLQGSAFGPGPFGLIAERHRQRERHLHPPVAGGVAVRSHDARHAHRSASSISAAGLK